MHIGQQIGPHQPKLELLLSEGCSPCSGKRAAVDVDGHLKENQRNHGIKSNHV